MLSAHILTFLFLIAPWPALAVSTCTTQYVSTSTKPVPTYTTIITLTTTLTESITTVTKTKSSGTVTVPSPNGFTPILYETTVNPPGPPAAKTANAVANLAATHQAIPSYPATVFCSTSTTKTVTKTLTSSNNNKAAGTTSTKTSTTTVPAATSYYACQADNLVDQGLGSGYNHAIEFLTYGGGGQMPYNQSCIIGTPSAYDCCVQCANTFPCTFAYWTPFFGADPPEDPQCCLFAYVDGGCDGGRSIGPAEFYYDPSSPNEAGEGFTVMNGQCGEILYGGAF
ncbi:hypothetical protein MMC21_003003 [Puttea exsequens]|nr:hypothetical protein [Puttea exsequens]